MSKKILPINYTSREFATIKKDLISYVKRYYPENFQDFNQASFGSLMLDTVAYIGDILSFYVDYQANESFMETAIEPNNVTKLAKQMGYRRPGSPQAVGTVAFFIIVPANLSTGGIDEKYLPTILQGTIIGSDEGIQYTLAEDVKLSLDDRIVVAQADQNGNPTSYAIKTYAKVISGKYAQQTEIIEEASRFLKIEIDKSNVTEIIDVYDIEGHRYHEVEYLSQNVIHRPLTNRNPNQGKALSTMKALNVPRRYIVEHEEDATYLIFGYGSDSEIKENPIADPSNVVLQMHGKRYITDKTFDPSRLIETDKFGIAPEDTTLIITYRYNDASSVDAASNSVTQIIEPLMRFDNPEELDMVTMDSVIGSLEVINEQPIIGGTVELESDDIKRRAIDAFATQNRAVTLQDYKSLVYNMPARFGTIKRCNVLQDTDSFKRNLNLYVVSEDVGGFLTPSTREVRENIKSWLSNYKMINDSVDILNARIINFGIEFFIVADYSENKYEVLETCRRVLYDEFTFLGDIGENFYIGDVFNTLKQITGVVDVVDVKITQKIGQGKYSTDAFDIIANTTNDGRYIVCPPNAILELKYSTEDIVGSVK